MGMAVPWPCHGHRTRFWLGSGPWCRPAPRPWHGRFFSSPKLRQHQQNQHQHHEQEPSLHCLLLRPVFLAHSMICPSLGLGTTVFAASCRSILPLLTASSTSFGTLSAGTRAERN